MTTFESGIPTPAFIKSLCQSQAYTHPVVEPRLVETHISWVILTGVFAYKIKKPVNFDFLDFSTLDKRLQACRDELRLNRRLAPALYLEVVPITGSEKEPCMNGVGVPFEYAVRMREFPQADQLDRQLSAGRLDLHDMEALAQKISEFHAVAPIVASDSAFGEPERVQYAIRENFKVLLSGSSGTVLAQLEALRDWSEARYLKLQPLLAVRKQAGFVREVHGDLHLSNLVRLEKIILPFDCIEFSVNLRCIDVVNDIAFLLMDLQFHGRTDLTYRLLNRYLEHSGDYYSLPLLLYYKVYRAMVRAKVAKLRGEGSSGQTRLCSVTEQYAYIEQAYRWIAPHTPSLILMHGLSGSGKSWLSDRVATQLPAIRLRSDVERKRLYGLGPQQASGSGLGSGIYSASASGKTYGRLADLAKAVLSGGETAIIDAAFLEREQRDKFRTLAVDMALPFGILACRSDKSELERRLKNRLRETSDASEAGLQVLKRQQITLAPLSAAEQRAALTVDTRNVGEIRSVIANILARCR
jgi:aminoglycoside phosphotransferase family enzyme/predicted kinase